MYCREEVKQAAGGDVLDKLVEQLQAGDLTLMERLFDLRFPSAAARTSNCPTDRLAEQFKPNLEAWQEKGSVPLTRMLPQVEPELPPTLLGGRSLGDYPSPLQQWLLNQNQTQPQDEQVRLKAQIQQALAGLNDRQLKQVHELIQHLDRSAEC
ncbi:MAG: hypothetical protein Q6K80_01820 [Thermostichus sp. DG_1_6_bins_120]